MIPSRTDFRTIARRLAAAVVLLLACPVQASANESVRTERFSSDFSGRLSAEGTSVRTGRYLERTTLVHDASQLNPLHLVASLNFSSRLTVGDALETALAGTGYRLLPAEDHPHPASRSLLRTRLPIPHQRFEGRRVDSVIAAVVGEGRGFRIEVDHVERRIRITPLFPPQPAIGPVPARTSVVVHDAAQGEALIGAGDR